VKAVTIHDREGGALGFDLIDLLQLLPPSSMQSTWRCCDVDALGPGAERLHTASASGEPLSGEELATAAEAVRQVIEGDFVAQRQGEIEPWLAIRAVDSSFYVVITNDDETILRVRGRFRDVRESPDDAAYWR
jgi:hypothetical protein